MEKNNGIIALQGFASGIFGLLGAEIIISGMIQNNASAVCGGFVCLFISYLLYPNGEE